MSSPLLTPTTELGWNESAICSGEANPSRKKLLYTVHDDQYEDHTVKCSALHTRVHPEISVWVQRADCQTYGSESTL